MSARSKTLAMIAKATGRISRKNDDVVNTITSMGTTRDPRNSTYYRYVRFDPQDLAEIYAAGGIPRRICDLPAKEMTRTGWTFQANTISADFATAVQDYVAKRERELDLRQVFREAETWARSQGGGIVVMGISDGAKALSEPLRPGRNRIKWLRAYERADVRIERICSNVNSKNYGKPELYRTWRTADGGVSGALIHASRVLHFRGLATPVRYRLENDNWDTSVIQYAYDAVRDLSSAFAGTGRLLNEFGLPVYKVDGQLEMIAGGNANLVVEAMSLLNLGKSLANAVVIDKEDEFTQASPTVAGLKDLLDGQKEHVAMLTGIPLTKLVGASPGGLNATGESDLRNWYDEVTAEKVDKHGSLMERVRSLILCEPTAPKGARGLKGWTQEPEPLYSLSDKERAEIELKRSQTAAIYYNMIDLPTGQRAMTVGEVRSNLRQSPDWVLDEEDAESETLSSALAQLLSPATSASFDPSMRADADPFDEMGVLRSFSVDEFDEFATDAYRDAAVGLGQQEAVRVASNSVFNLKNPTFSKALDTFTLNHLPDINATTRKALSTIFADVSEAGLGREATVRRMRDVYEDFSIKRATTIVRTEMTQLQSAANYSVWDEAGIEETQWSASFRNTRDSHAKMHNQRRAQGIPFESGAGHKALHPGGFGVASEDINCQCVQLPVTGLGDVVVDEDGRQARDDAEAEGIAQARDRAIEALYQPTVDALMRQFDKAAGLI